MTLKEDLAKIQEDRVAKAQAVKDKERADKERRRKEDETRVVRAFQGYLANDLPGELRNEARKGKKEYQVVRDEYGEALWLVFQQWGIHEGLPCRHETKDHPEVPSSRGEPGHKAYTSHIFTVQFG